MIVGDKAFTMEDLRKDANNNVNLSVKLPTVRDVSMYIKVKDASDGKYLIYQIKIYNSYFILISIKNNIEKISSLFCLLIKFI